MSLFVKYKINFSWDLDNNGLSGTDVAQIEIRYRRVSSGETTGLSWETSKWITPTNSIINFNGDNYYSVGGEQYYKIELDVEYYIGVEFIYRGKDNTGNISTIWSNGSNGDPIPNNNTIEFEPDIRFSNLTSPEFIDLTLPTSPVLDNFSVIVGGLTGSTNLVKDLDIYVKNADSGIIQVFKAEINRLKKYWSKSINLFQGNNEITLKWIKIDDTVYEVDNEILTLLCDTFAPTGTIIINEGSNSTTNSKIFVKFEVSDISQITHYRVANDLELLESESWVIFPETNLIEFELSTEEGSYTIYAQCKDKWDHISEILSDSIVLDNTPPETTITNLVPQIRTTIPIVLSGTAIDSISGVEYVEILIMDTKNRIFNGEYWHSAEYWIRVTGTENWSYSFNYNKQDVYRVWVRACDKVGNLKHVNINNTIHDYAFSYGTPTIHVNIGDKIQDAIDAVLLDGTIIILEATIYTESFDLRDEFSFTIRGQGADKTFIHSSNSEYICNGAGSEGCVLENICFDGIVLPNSIAGIILDGTNNNIVHHCLLKYLNVGLTTGYKAINYNINHITAVNNCIAFQLSNLDTGEVKENIFWKNIFGVKVI